MTQEARADADRIREEALDMLERARAEDAALAARRVDITRQLGHLSGVIEALAVPETTRTSTTPTSPHEETEQATR